MAAKRSSGSVQASLSKAQQLLDDAERCFEQGMIETAIDRSYYSMFHAARAILAHRGVSLPKTHSGLRTVLGREVRAWRDIPLLFYRSLADVATLREEATYTADEAHGRELAERVLAEASEFVEMARDRCGKAWPHDRAA